MPTTDQISLVLIGAFAREVFTAVKRGGRVVLTRWLPALWRWVVRRWKTFRRGLKNRADRRYQYMISRSPEDRIALLELHPITGNLQLNNINHERLVNVYEKIDKEQPGIVVAPGKNGRLYDLTEDGVRLLDFLTLQK